MSAYTTLTIWGYALFYIGTFLLLPAAFERYDPQAQNFHKLLPESRVGLNRMRLILGVVILVIGGIIQVVAELGFGQVSELIWGGR